MSRGAVTRRRRQQEAGQHERDRRLVEGVTRLGYNWNVREVEWFDRIGDERMKRLGLAR